MDIVKEFITHTILVIREAVGYYDDSTGRFVSGSTTNFNVDVSIQPINQKERILLPNSVANKEVIKLYHSVKLQITDDFIGSKGDTFTYNGRKYRIFSTSDWSNGNYDLKFFKSFAVMSDKTNTYV